MPIPGKVQVTGVLAPTDSADEFPVTDPQYGLGALRTVMDDADLNAITDQRRQQGMLVYVIDDLTYYMLNAPPWDGTLTDWTAIAFGGTPGGSSGDLQFNDGSGNFAGGGLNWNGTTLLFPTGVLGPHGGTRITNNTGAFDLSQADWFVRTLNGTNGVISFINPKPSQVLTIEFIQGGVGGHTIDWSSLGVITWMTPGSVTPVIGSSAGVRSSVLLKRTSTGYLGWLTGNQEVIASGVGSPGGATGDLQWNNAGVFAGGGPIWDGTSELSVPGTITLGSGSVIPKIISFGSSGNSITLAAGTEMGFDAGSYEFRDLDGNTALHVQYGYVAFSGASEVDMDWRGSAPFSETILTSLRFINVIDTTTAVSLAMINVSTGTDADTGVIEFFLRKTTGDFSLTKVASFDQNGDFNLTGGKYQGDGSALTGISTGAVSSVFTRTGAITAQSGDYNVSQITGAAPLASPGLTGTPTFAGSTSGTTGVRASATASGTLTLPAVTDTLVGKNTTDILTNKTLTSPTINDSTVNTHVSPKATVSSVSGVTTCDASLKESFTTTLTENTALLVTNAKVDQIIRVKVIQAATPFTFTYSGTMTITWYTSGFSAPTMPTTNGKAMKLVLECTGTNTFDGFWAGNNG